MAHRLEQARTLVQRLTPEMQREAEELKERLNRGVFVSVADVKAWRNRWIGEVVPVRKSARALKDEDSGLSDDIKSLAVAFEDAVKAIEQQLQLIATELERAQARGGILTPEERAARAASEGRLTRTIPCVTCGAPLPDKDAAQCAFCGHERIQGAAASSGWAIAGIDGAGDTAASSAEDVHRAGRARLDALEKTYKAQLELERDGLLEVLAAGKRRTLELEHASDDATVRLERIWQKIRLFGSEVEDRLDDLGASEQSSDIDRRTDQLLDQLTDLKSAVMEPVHRQARLEWNRDQSGTGGRVKCSWCGAELKVDNPEAPGTARCNYCDGMTTYGPHLDRHAVALMKEIDAQVEARRSVEDEFAHWKQQCVTDPSDTNLQRLAEAARGAYDKQLFYIADPEKRRAAVDRYVAQAVSEASSRRS